jgi:hypothetical protein
LKKQCWAVAQFGRLDQSSLVPIYKNFVSLAEEVPSNLKFQHTKIKNKKQNGGRNRTNKNQ